MSCNDDLRDGEFKQERGGGKIQTKRNTQDAPKPYDRPVSAFGRIFAAVKDILKPALVTEAMSRVHEAQKEEKRTGGIDKSECDTGYKILCDSSGAEEVTVEVDGYQAVFQSRVLHDEMAHLKNKLAEAVTSSEQACEQQLSFRRNAPEPSSREFQLTSSTPAGLYPNKTFSPSGLVSYHASGPTRCNDLPRTSNDVPRSSGYEAVSATKRKDARRDTAEMRSTNGAATIATPSKLQSTNGVPSSSYRRYGAETSATKPGFKMSRFCESVEKIRSGMSVLNRSRAELAALSESCGADSSFYAGRTSFGGAASAHKMNAKTSSVSTSPYQTRPTVRKCPQVSGGGGEAKAMSVTAQRILDTMEKNEESSMYLNRSRDSSICNSPLSFSPSYRRNSSQFASKDVSTRQSGGPPVKQLMTPSVSVLKPMKATVIEPRDTYQDLRQTLSDQRMDVQALRETGYSLPFGNTQLSGIEDVKSSAAIGGKCKKPPKHYVSRLSDVDEASSNSALASIQPFPKFPVNFSFSMPKVPIIIDALTDTKETAIGARGSERSLAAFVFSLPKIVQEMPENDTPRFTPSAAKPTSEKAEVVGTSAVVPLTSLFKKSSNVWTCSECLVDNKCTDTVCVACMTPRPMIGSAESDKNKPPISQTPAGAALGFTLDTKGGGFKFGSGSISNTGFGEKFGSAAQNGASNLNFSSNNSGTSTSFGGFKFSGSLGGDARIVRKEGDLDGFDSLTRPPLRSDVAKSPERKVSNCAEESAKDKPLSELFKKPTNIWTCSECYISNKNEQDRCVSCEAAKPVMSTPLFTQFGSNAVTKVPLTKVPDTVTFPADNPISFGAKPLSELFKKPADSWTCEECFVLNKSIQTTCLSCDTVKPGNTVLTTSQPTVSLDSSKSLSELFKKPVDVWTCSECYVSNKIDRTTCQSCDTAKPRAAQSPVLPSAGPKISCDAKPLSELFKKPVDVWTCSKCYVSNKNDRTTCQSCETAKPRVTQPSVLPSAGEKISCDAKPLSELFKKPVDIWTCSECYVSNKNVRNTCMSCDSAKPRATQSQVLPSAGQNISSDAKPLGELFTKWTCNECYVSNKNERTTCQSCDTAKPRVTPPPVVPSAGQNISSDAKPLSELFKKSVEAWTCRECYISNRSVRATCMSCETPRPSKHLPPSLSSVPSQVVSTSAVKPLSELFKKSADTWTCNECYVTNKIDKTSCASCETVRPGTSVPVQVQTSGPPMFTFGAQNAGTFGSSTGQATPALNVSNTLSKPSTHPFQFGQQLTEAKATRPFVFGQPLPLPNDDVAGKVPSFTAETKTQTFSFSQPNLGGTASVSAESVSLSNVSSFGAGFQTHVSVINSNSSASVTGASLRSTSATVLFGSSAALPAFGAHTTAANPFVFGAPVSSASTLSSVSDQKPIQTGVGVSVSTTLTVTPLFGTATGSNATIAPQFGASAGSKATVTPQFGTSTGSNAAVTPQFGAFGSSTGFNATVTPQFGASTGSNATVTPQFGAFGSSTGSSATVTPQFGASTESKAKVTPQFGAFGASTGSSSAVTPRFGTFGSSAGSNATSFGSSSGVTPQFGSFAASFVPPARAGSIFGSTSSSSTPQSGFVAPSFSTPQFGSSANDVTKTSSTAPSFTFGTGDSQSTSTLFTFGRQAAADNQNSSSSMGSGSSLASNPAKRSIDESDASNAKRSVGNFSFGASSTSQSASFTFGQFQGTTAAPVAAAPGLAQGFNFGSSAPMFNIPPAAGVAPSSGVFQFGSSDAKPPSFQNPFDVGSSSSSAGAVPNRVIKRAERRLGKNRR